MAKENCWEYHKCGREPGGVNQHLGPCPVPREQKLDGVHDGKFAGRACWVVAGTYCKGELQGTFAKKYNNCEKCSFYRKVETEEGSKRLFSIVLLEKLKRER